MGYRSGEFATSLNLLAAPPASGICTTGTGPQLWLIGSTYGPSNDESDLGFMIQSNFETPGNLPLGTAADPSKWHGIGYLPTAGPSETLARSALVMSDSPYLFWNELENEFPISSENSSGIYTSNYQPGSSTPWITATHLAGKREGNAAIIPNSCWADVSATPFGSDTILVACPSVGYSAPPPCTQSDQNLYFGVFNTADNGNPTSGVWIPRYEWTWALSDLQQLFPDIGNPGQSLSIDWFATGADGDTGPVLYLAMFLRPASAPICLYVRLALDATDESTPLVDDQYIPTPWWDVLSGSQAITIARDPAGQLRGYASNPTDKTIDTYTLSTVTQPDQSKSGTGSALPVTIDYLPAPSAAGAPPAVSFYVALDRPESISVDV